MLSIYKRNNALSQNPPYPGVLSITERGSDWLWAAFCIFAITGLMLGVVLVAWPQKQNRYLLFALAALTVAIIEYFTWASNLGFTVIATEFNHYHNADYRQIFYCKWVGYFLWSSLLCASFSKFARIYWVQGIWTVVLQEIVAICLLIGSLISSSYKFGYFGFACFAFLLLAFQLVAISQQATQLYLGSKNAAFIYFVVAWYILLTLLYLIAWCLCEGANVISPDSETIFFGILDISYLIVFSIGFLLFNRSLPVIEVPTTETKPARLGGQLFGPRQVEPVSV